MVHTAVPETTIVTTAVTNSGQTPPTFTTVRAQRVNPASVFGPGSSYTLRPTYQGQPGRQPVGSEPITYHLDIETRVPIGVPIDSAFFNAELQRARREELLRPAQFPAQAPAQAQPQPQAQGQPQPQTQSQPQRDSAYFNTFSPDQIQQQQQDELWRLSQIQAQVEAQLRAQAQGQPQAQAPGQPQPQAPSQPQGQSQPQTQGQGQPQTARARIPGVPGKSLVTD